MHMCKSWVFRSALLRRTWTGCCRSSKHLLFNHGVLPVKNSKPPAESWWGYGSSFSHLQDEACGQMQPVFSVGLFSMRMAVPHMHRAELYRDLACPVRSLNMILICSIYSVTAVLTDFIVEPSMCQTFLHSFYFPVLLIARKPWK